MCACSLVCLPTAVTCEERKVPLYTNADLERVAPYRDQTGVNSAPAAPAPSTRKTASKAGIVKDTSAAKEQYWRREAERHRVRLVALRSRIQDIAGQLDAQRERPLRYAQLSQIHRLERRLSDLETQLRELDADFEERARREGALPGWLR
jgi:hypothetical protein